MKHRWAVFGRFKDWLMDVMASTEEEALALAKVQSPYAERVILVRPGNDLGTDGN